MGKLDDLDLERFDRRPEFMFDPLAPFRFPKVHQPLYVTACPARAIHDLRSVAALMP